VIKIRELAQRIVKMQLKTINYQKKPRPKTAWIFIFMNLAVRPHFALKTKNKNPVYKLYNTNNQFFTKQKRDNH
jgi:hypothetical protein